MHSGEGVVTESTQVSRYQHLQCKTSDTEMLPKLQERLCSFCRGCFSVLSALASLSLHFFFFKFQVL